MDAGSELHREYHFIEEILGISLNLSGTVLSVSHQLLSESCHIFSRCISPSLKEIKFVIQVAFHSFLQQALSLIITELNTWKGRCP